MTYFIAYDVSDPKRLRMVAKTLENYGLRIQYSFFQCEINKEMLDTLVSELVSIIDKEEDSLHVYPLCENCLSTAESFGSGSIFVPRSYEIL